MIRLLGSYVREKRERLGLNQKELAERCGLPANSINRIEQGVTKVPSPDFRRRLAHGLGVSHIDVLVAAGELEPDEVEAAGVQGVVPENPNEARVIEDLRSLPNLTDWEATVVQSAINTVRMSRERDR
jgi:transcriptional regulator with XRE-family HTH domain